VYVGERIIALFLLDGEVFALDDRCPHKAGPLGEGHCENGQVFCPLHGWAFDIKTGACADVPSRPAKCIPVRVEDGKVYLV
jgi:nitrite reductase (NADH) small subunit